MEYGASIVLTAADLRVALEEPRRLTDMWAWHGHIPFAFVVVRLASPRRIVELGTAKGDSYCAFCQAVDLLGLQAECAAIDTWAGDAHSGELPVETLTELRTHHDPRYSRFSQLIRSTFDEALGLFADGSIDLLHIDGYHTYEAVRHDFESWLPKLSEQGVVLLHDTAVREGDFGVWRLWSELETQYPSYAFVHSFGLGVVAVGASVDDEVIDFLNGASNDGGMTASLFAALGERLVARTREEELRTSLAAEAAARAHAEEQLRSATEARARAEEHVRALLAMRRFRYTRAVRTAYERVRHH